MNTKIFSAMWLVVFCALLISSASSRAEDIKARMEARLPIIKELKVKGIVGEDNRGYLQFVGTKRERENEISAENSDRRSVYEAIAQQQGTTIEFVGKRRALQIMENAAPGEWFQNENGKWYQKK